MSEQAQPVEPAMVHEADRTTSDDGQSTAPAASADQSGKSRAVYRDPKGSESTRELRDTARRRRDSEEKLQQHLIEAKDHVPNDHHEHEHHDEGHHPDHGQDQDHNQDGDNPGTSRAGETGNP
ncbi:hypothetical protein ACU18_17705 [Arthrobacter sp. ZBG10]|jgi:hypothetical protein|uniref:hypothetical protein n=1 Tax=Micrococcaceae TaxID=1268 RepID=UPI0006A4877F|nr:MULTISPECIES: hypothetical protein [Micrococcaceae]KNH15274.1 hypothetical protein ACU18_17705 [Arthrobacter sp. ZBG10]